MVTRRIWPHRQRNAMPKIEISGRMAACLPVLALVCAGLTACGGSSGSASHSSASTTRPSSTTATAPTAKTPSTGTTTTAHVPSSNASARLRALRRSGAPAHRTIVSPAQSAAFRTALVSFATCLRQNGVKIPAPNASGKGPVLSTKGLNTNTPQYRAALMKCRTVLLGAFRQATRSQATKHG
jgi:hypothetical protein